MRQRLDLHGYIIGTCLRSDSVLVSMDAHKSHRKSLQLLFFKPVTQNILYRLSYYQEPVVKSACFKLSTLYTVCVYSSSRNDVLRVAQRYGTIAAHTRRHASVLVVFVVFLLAYVQFCRFDKADATADVQ